MSLRHSATSVEDSTHPRPRRRGLTLTAGALAVVLLSWLLPTTLTTAAGDTTRPSAPSDLSVDVNRDGTLTASWTASWDNVGVARYVVSRNNVEVLTDVTGLSATVDLGVGDHWIQVRAVDAAGNVGVKTPPVKVTVTPDTRRPSAPSGLSVVVNGDGSLTASWSAARDDRGVARYVVSRNNVEVLTDVTGLSATVDLGVGDHWIQVRAVDAAGNVGVKTPPVKVTVEAPVQPDTTAPSAPGDLTVIVDDDDSLSISWSASWDDVAVDHYVVVRNDVEVLTGVTGLSATIDAGLGDHWIQVRAVDTAGNVGAKTAPVKVSVLGDVVAPSAPADLAVVATGDAELTATWTASSDDVGVVAYRVFSNGERVDPESVITGTQYTFAVESLAVPHVVTIEAVDAAGNASDRSAPVEYVDTPDPVPAATGWSPMRARDEAGAVLPYRVGPSDAPATIVVDAAGGADHTSIRAAVSAAGPSDVIEVRSGVYRESIGVVNKQITLRAADGAHPVVLGTERVELGALTGGATRTVQVWSQNPLKSLDSGLNEGSYFYGGLVDASDPVRAAGLLPEQVFWVDGAGTWHEVGQRRHGAALDTNTFSYDPTNQTFAIRLANWSIVDHLEVTVRREGLRLLGGADGSSVSGFEFRAFSPPTDGDGWATVATNGNGGDRLRNVVLRDIEVTDSASNGVSAYSASDVTLTRVTANHNVIKGLNTGRLHGLRLEFSRFDDNNKDRLRDVYSMLAGAKITGNTGDDPGSVVRYNSFAGNHATGYWCDLWCENDVIVGNYAGDNTKHGIYYEVSEDAVIASNLLVRNGAAGVKVSGSQRVDVVRNTFVGNAQHVHLGTDTRPRTGPGDGNRRPGHPVVTDTADIWIDGNVFAEVPGAFSRVIHRVGGASGEGLRNLPSERLDGYDRNGHVLNTSAAGSRRFEWDHGLTWESPTDFVANSGLGPTEVTVRGDDPFEVFVDGRGGDWRLAAGSAIATSLAHPLPADALAEMVGGDGPVPIGAVLG